MSRRKMVRSRLPVASKPEHHDITPTLDLCPANTLSGSPCPGRWLLLLLMLSSFFCLVPLSLLRLPSSGSALAVDTNDDSEEEADKSAEEISEDGDDNEYEDVEGEEGVEEERDERVEDDKGNDGEEEDE